MSKSNPVHLWRFGCTRALIFTQKWLYRPGWHLQKNKNVHKKKLGGLSSKKNPVSGRAMGKGKMLHFVAFFVHFDKLIRPHPGPLCPPPPWSVTDGFPNRCDPQAEVHWQSHCGNGGRDLLHKDFLHWANIWGRSAGDSLSCDVTDSSFYSCVYFKVVVQLYLIYMMTTKVLIIWHFLFIGNDVIILQPGSELSWFP